MIGTFGGRFEVLQRRKAGSSTSPTPTEVETPERIEIRPGALGQRATARR
ncbi:hypothetical protein ACPA9J_15695 [Pseudomonas aeruginosa]